MMAILFAISPIVSSTSVAVGAQEGVPPWYEYYGSSTIILQALSEMPVLTVVDTQTGWSWDLYQSDFDGMVQLGPIIYSNYNTFPTYGNSGGLSGVPITEVLQSAGINTATLHHNREIKFISADGYRSTMTWGQVSEARYYFDNTGMRGMQVPAIVAFSSTEPGEVADLPRNYIGQVAASEQTRNVFARGLAIIEVGADAGTWGAIVTNPASGSTVRPGGLIRLTTPGGDTAANAKIHYTLDGSPPTRESAMYNRVGEQWFGNVGLTENVPIPVPPGSGTLTIRAKLFGLGKGDGQEYVFTYPYETAGLLDQSMPTGLVGGRLVITGTTTAMEYHTNASATSGWVRCSAGSTILSAGTYFVRYSATTTHNASPSAQVTVIDKLTQSAPTGLSGGVEVINGTTTAMEYHTSATATNGWVRCSSGSTSVTAGTYVVRFSGNADYHASPSVTILVTNRVELLNQSAPTGLSGGVRVVSGVKTYMITGTTTAMEYNKSATTTSGWLRCSASSTTVIPGTYYVRFAATTTHNASPTTAVVVSEEPTILSVYVGGSLAKAISQSDIDALQKYGPYTYSDCNTWPTYGSKGNITGVRVTDLLSISGVGSLSSGQGITITSNDGYRATITAGQLSEPRYYFSSSGVRGAQVPSIICTTPGSDYLRFIFGQAAASEQTNMIHVKNVARIDVGSHTGSWGSPGVTPASGSTVARGALIRLTMPSGQADAKIYYTLDGSTPTRNSPMYNPVADRWLFQKGLSENTPITAPSASAFTIRAKIIGIGKSDGPEVSFNFNSAPPTSPTGSIKNTTIEDLTSGNTTVKKGDSFFVPAEKGSITWNEDEMDGYYDEELGGYVLTPKEGVEGNIEFTYVDEDGVEHTLSVEVEPEPTGIAAAMEAVNEALPEWADLASRSPWAIPALIAMIALAGGVLGWLAAQLQVRIKSKRATQLEEVIVQADSDV